MGKEAVIKAEPFMYGVVFILEREQEIEHVRRSLRKMRALEMNTVVIWPAVFYDGGKPEFTRHLSFLDAAHEAGLRVIIELTGQVADLEYFPNHLYADEYAVKNFDGTVAKMQNGLGEMNYNHPFVKEAMKEYLVEAVEAYRGHPALYGWDVWNETHFKSYDEYTLAEFQRWLRRKYQDVRELNRAWNKTYTDFSQVRFEQVTWASVMPDVDWEEFRTDNLAAIAAELTGYVRAIDQTHPVIADNVMANAVWSEFDRGTDDFKLAATVDRYGISFYPKTGGRLLSRNEPWLRALTFDAAAAAGRGEFLISELQSHYYSEIFTRERVTPDDVVIWCFEALARNCRGIVFWKWTPFKRGFQVGGRGLLLADGSFSKRADAAARIGRFLKAHPDFASEPLPAAAGVLFDRHNNYLVKTINNRVHHIIGSDQPQHGLFGLYRTCFEQNIPLRIVERERLSDDLKSLETLFLPYQVTMDDAIAEEIKAFVERGGRLIANYPFADVNRAGELFEQIPGGPLHAMLGVKHLDNIIMERGAFRLAGGGDLPVKGGIELQEIALIRKDLEIAAFAGDHPLVIAGKHGKGKIFYIVTPIWNLIYDQDLPEMGTALLKQMTPELFEQRTAVANVPVRVFENDGTRLVCIFNENKSPKVKLTLRRPRAVPEMIFGEAEICREDEETYSIAGDSCVYALKI